MCGIAGIVFFEPHQQSEKIIFQMNQALSHRGPDDEGYVFFKNSDQDIYGGNDTPPNVYNSTVSYCPNKRIENFETYHWNAAFTHRRLSIIDLSSDAHQPISNNDAKLWMVYNGEVYNYEGLKNELQTKNIKFESKSDTEVVLKAYENWGDNFVEKLNGMWAIAIYDKPNNQILLSRDRFGVKPLYYIHTDKYFAFSSEQKTLLQLPFFQTSINQNAAFEYLAMGITERVEQGLFENIKELMPAHNLKLDVSSAKFKLTKYYQLEYHHNWQTFDQTKFDHYRDKVEDLIFESIKLRLSSNAQLGSCLSGGIDSSSIVCATQHLMKQSNYSQIGNQLKVFTSSYSNFSEIDESKWAKLVVELTNSKWYQIETRLDDFLEHIKNITYAQDIPILTTSTVAQYSVMKCIHEQGVKVTLDGQGADELFGGYPAHLSAFFCEKLKNEGKLSSSQLQNLKNNLVYPTKHITAKLFWKYFLRKGFRNARPEFQLINNHFWQKNSEQLNYIKNKFSPNLNQMLFQQFTGHDLKVLLRTGDRNAMHFSIESRMPFTDHHPLVEYLFQIPSSFKIKNHQSKFLLRESMKSYIPKEIYSRKDKLGFAAPENLWLKNARSLLSENKSSDLKEYFDYEKLIKNWNQFIQIPNSTQRLYRMVQFAIWKKTFNL